MASPETRTLIRHPLLWRPSAPAPPPAPPLSLSAAPPEVLRHVASYIDTARDLLSFSAVCTATRCAPPLGLLSTRADRVSRGFAHPRSCDSLVALDEALWKQLTLRTFPVPLCAAPPSPTPVRPDFARPG
jgi:hypothetical protein